MKQVNSVLASIVIGQLAFVACGSANPSVTEIPMASPTIIEEIPQATKTSTQAPQSSPTLVPTEAFTATETPTEIPAPLPKVSVISDFTYVRSGPGTMYEIVATATKGLEMEIEGRSWAYNWLATPLPWGEQGWVFAPDMSDIDRGALPLIVVPEPTEAPYYTITVSNRTGGQLRVMIFDIGLRNTYNSSSPKSFTLQGGVYTITVKVIGGGPPCVKIVVVDSDIYWEPTLDDLCPPYREAGL